ncbi:short-chain fatty acyl-CoA regulator family protein [Nocardia sp. NPDC046763]|uniref:short-chain fatty acyl-CoA regulator family protein n=1 Tax=Nocardia sp. NPDC046763 TaxID=3155256 RepID=UPI0033E00ED8
MITVLVPKFVDASYLVGAGGDLGLPIDDPRAAVPIGAGCKVRERADCAQRAFPQLGRPIRVDDNSSQNIPYVPATAA